MRCATGAVRPEWMMSCVVFVHKTSSALASSWRGDTARKDDEAQAQRPRHLLQRQTCAKVTIPAA